MGAQTAIAWAPPDERPWQRDAACLGKPEMMWLQRGASREAIAEARALCADCPVLGDCREWALSQGPKAVLGFVGGMSERERRHERARRRRGETRG